jgi:competence protein ComEC
VRVWCRLRRPAPAPPGESSALRSLLRASQTQAWGSVKSARLVELVERDPRRARRFVATLRASALDRLDRLAGPDPEVRSLTGALLLGERHRLGVESNRVLRDSGLLHLVAISGLHVGLVVLMLHLALRAARAPLWSCRLVLAAAIPVYTVLVGAQTPVCRAALGAVLALFGRAVGRDGEPLNGLAVVAAVLVAWQPTSVAEPAFQLTVAATAGILGSRPGDRPGLPRWVTAAAGASLAAYLATAPLVALHFGWLAPVGLLTNLVAVPLNAIVLGAGYLALAFHGLPLVGPCCGWALRSAAAALLDVADLAASWPDGAFPVARPGAPVVLAYYAALLLAARGRPSPTVRSARVLLGLLLIWLHLGPPPPGPGPVGLTLIDVGQGQSVALRGPSGATLLVDAGGSANPRFDPGERRVIPALVDAGTRRVALLAVSHGHEDHCGGARALLRELEIGELWLGPGHSSSPRLAALAELARRRGVAVLLAECGLGTVREGLALRVLAPCRGETGPVNDRSLVVLAGDAPARALVPGDLEASGEAALLEQGSAIGAEALVLGHHGSRDSSSAAFLGRVRPAWALVSAGRWNRFGHPHAETLQRVERQGIPLLRTDRDGTISLRAGPHGWIPEARLAAVLDHANGDQDERQHEHAE